MQFGIAFVSGGLLGAATSFHCVANCGTIATTLALMRSGGAASSTRARDLVAPHVGRVAAYMCLGAIAASAVGGLGVLLRLDGAQSVLQALASCSLAWTGARLAGVVPSRMGTFRIASNIFKNRPGLWSTGSSLFAIGVGWGVAPCAMVYTALLTASMTGSISSASIFMFGFGVATVPALASLVIGQFAAQRIPINPASRQTARKVIGFALITLALVNIAVPRAGGLLELCA
jgi:sulfite exporter TauE/SafE